MKSPINYIIALFITFILGSCSSPSENTMMLSGEISGLKKGTLLLQKLEDTVLVSVDSIVINGDSNFNFIQEVESPEVYYIYLKKEGTISEDRVAFFAEPGEVNITTSLKNFGYDAVVSGSENQSKLNDYQKLMKRYSDRNLTLIQESFQATKNGKDSLANALKEQQNKIVATKYLATVNFALQNNDSELAPYLMLTEVYDANLKYLDTVYNTLTPKIKDSKYGKALESFISERKQ